MMRIANAHADIGLVLPGRPVFTDRGDKRCHFHCVVVYPKVHFLIRPDRCDPAMCFCWAYVVGFRTPFVAEQKDLVQAVLRVPGGELGPGASVVRVAQ